jgi:DNA topoisomerase-2
LQYSKGTITLFNELVNNSFDEYIRTRDLHKSKRLTEIDIVINKQTNEFSVKDNGGIPVVHHKGNDMMLPTMLFGHLRSGSNYDDSKRGNVSGVNGVGASLVNVMSKSFIVSTCDGTNIFTQEWQDNMSKSSKELILPAKKTSGFTQIIAQFDWARLDMPGFTDDLCNKFVTRTAEVAAMGANKDLSKALQTSITIIDDNGNVEFTKTFKYEHFWQFSKLIDGVAQNFWGEAYENLDFEFGPSSSDTFESISIVNSIRCDYGTHIDAITYWAAEHIRWFLNKKHKIDLKPKQIIDRMRVISRWSINAPSFSNQTKDELVTAYKDFGFIPEMSMKFKQSLEKSEIVARLVDFHQHKQSEEERAMIRKQQKDKVRPQSIEKLVDATSKNRKDCMLFIAEGDSAMGGVRQHRTAETQGAFALGGKFINSIYRQPKDLMKVKGKTTDSKAKTLCDALGLAFNQNALETLRYGQIAIMTDADYDGFAISCQLVLFFKKFWPELFEHGIIKRVISPIMVARKGKDVKYFYSMDDYNAAKETLEKQNYKSKHIKGLAALRIEDYAEVIQNPILQTITADEYDWATLDAWFNDDASQRKVLVNM